MTSFVTKKELNRQLANERDQHEHKLEVLRTYYDISRHTSLRLSEYLFTELDTLFGRGHDGEIELQGSTKVATYYSERIRVTVDPFRRTAELIDTTGCVARQDLLFDSYAQLDATQRRLMIGFASEVHNPIGSTPFWHGTGSENLTPDLFGGESEYDEYIPNADATSDQSKTANDPDENAQNATANADSATSRGIPLPVNTVD